MAVQRFIADEGIQVDNVRIATSGNGEIDTSSGNLTLDSTGGTVIVDDALTVNDAFTASQTASVAGNLVVSSTASVATLEVVGNALVSGNLTVSGSSTIINTETLMVDDNVIVLNHNVTAEPTENAGIEVERGSESNVQLRWNETSHKWELTNDGTTYGDIATESFVSSTNPSSLENIGDVTITSAATDDFLKWNGSAWINDQIDLGTDTVGNFMSDVSASTGISVDHTPGEGSSATITNTGVLSVNGATGDINGVVTTADTGTVTSTMISDGTIVDGDISASAGIAASKISGTAITAADTGTVTSTMIADGTIVDGDINASAGIALSKLATSTAGNIIVYDSSGVPTSVAETGDVLIDSNGVTSISSGVIVNADINDSAGISISKLAPAGTSAQVIVADSTGVPSYRTISGDVTISDTGVTSIAANSVALGTDTTGNYVATITAGTGVTSTGATTGEGIAHTISIGQAVGTTSEVTFSGVKSTSVIEPLTISATAATGTIAIDAANGTTYYTTNATANWVVNLRWNSSTTLDSKLSTGEMTTTSFLARQGATPYYPTSIQVNGTTSGVTTRWQGGTAPTSGNANSTDMYTFTAVKTGAATFDVFAAQTRFA